MGAQLCRSQEICTLGFEPNAVAFLEITHDMQRPPEGGLRGVIVGSSLTVGSSTSRGMRCTNWAAQEPNIIARRALIVWK